MRGICSPAIGREFAVIRQAITCDICGSEKRQTNHWFVAYELGGELRLSGWSSRHRTRPETKHLCGQTCLHKLVDEFMARSIAVRAQLHEEEEPVSPIATDASLTANAAYEEVESSVRLLTPAESTALRPSYRQPAELVTISQRTEPAELAHIPEEPRFATPSRRAEAWEREREREMRAAEHRPDIVRRSSQQ